MNRAIWTVCTLAKFQLKLFLHIITSLWSYIVFEIHHTKNRVFFGHTLIISVDIISECIIISHCWQPIAFEQMLILLQWTQNFYSSSRKYCKTHLAQYCEWIYLCFNSRKSILTSKRCEILWLRENAVDFRMRPNNVSSYWMLYAM